MQFLIHFHPGLATPLEIDPFLFEADSMKTAIDELIKEWPHIVTTDGVSDHMTIIYGGNQVLMITDGTITPTEEDWVAASRHYNLPACMPLSIKDIDRWARTQPQVRRDEWGYIDEETNWLSHFIGSGADDLYVFMHRHGLDVKGDWITFDVKQFPVIRAVANAVSEEYDLPMDEIGDVDSLWRQFQLRGDDDVDYNGSYVITATDILWAYHLDHRNKRTGHGVSPGNMEEGMSNVQVNVGKIETEIEAIGSMNLGDQVTAALGRIKDACVEIRAAESEKAADATEEEEGDAAE